MEPERDPYKNVCVEKGESYYNYENYVPEWK